MPNLLKLGRYFLAVPLLVFAILLCVLIVYRHRGNIARLLAGTENRFKKT